jgi:general secretion pathway protein H
MTSRGFTLIEVLVVVAIVALLATMTIPAISAVTGANARQAAGEVAGAMRWLFDTAALRHQTCRLAIDLDNQAWWAECTEGKHYLSRKPEESRGGESAEVEEEDDEALAERFPDERSAEKRRLLAKARFGQFKDREGRKRELPNGAAFQEVWTQHQREPYSKGMAYVYFHAQGQAERAHVPISDGDDFYTVVLQPYTGRAKVVPGKLEVPR